jgi:hypothetical protein
VVLTSMDLVETRAARVVSWKLGDEALTYGPPREIPPNADLRTAFTIAGARFSLVSNANVSRAQRGKLTAEPDRTPELQRMASTLYFSQVPGSAKLPAEAVERARNAIRSLPEFTAFRAANPEDEEEETIHRYVRELGFPLLDKFDGQTYPVDAVQTYFSTYGFDIGRPATRMELRSKLTSLLLATPEGKASESIVSYVEHFLVRERPRSLDSWK